MQCKYPILLCVSRIAFLIHKIHRGIASFIDRCQYARRAESNVYKHYFPLQRAKVILFLSVKGRRTFALCQTTRNSNFLLGATKKILYATRQKIENASVSMSIALTLIFSLNTVISKTLPDYPHCFHRIQAWNIERRRVIYRLLLNNLFDVF